MATCLFLLVILGSAAMYLLILNLAPHALKHLKQHLKHYKHYKLTKRVQAEIKKDLAIYRAEKYMRAKYDLPYLQSIAEDALFLLYPTHEDKQGKKDDLLFQTLDRLRGWPKEE
ncbi:MAG: hypothetical protein FWG40_00490 [Peptococcaceae bacterium]|nr:hypothetical protein [Peptococcaceae bacterium]